MFWVSNTGKKAMIISKIIGGLGNQMFQYAAGKRAAHTNKTILKLDITGYNNQAGITKREYMLNIFNIEENIAKENEIIRLKKINKKFLKRVFSKLNTKVPFSRESYIRDKHHYFDPNILKLKNNSYLDGYWQSEKYFKDIEDIIRKEFTFKKKMDKINKKIINKITCTNSISIHIRRGDYATDKKTKKYHGICDLEYYHNAISLIAKRIEKPHFFVFSDDPIYVKKNLRLKYFCDYVNNNIGKKDYEDLRLMSSCRHNIIANSSFSWWGAWLNQNPNKIIITPKKWFNKEIITKDLIPSLWIKLQ